MNFSFLKKKQTEQERQRERRRLTANEFLNVQDIRGSYLYAKDGLMFCYLTIQPVSLDLLSNAERQKRIRTFAAEFSSEKDDFKIFAISRPVDISRTTNHLARIMRDTSNPIRRKILYDEIRAVSAFALSGEVIQRQFYMVLWRQMQDSDREREEKQILHRAREMQNKFRNCDIHSAIADETTIIQLCNLFANPAYVHLEDTGYDIVLPTLPD